MFEFTDRVPATGKENRKKITFDDGTIKYAKVEYADDANPVGTPLNKATFESMQPITGGYVGNGEETKTITFEFNPSFVIFYTDFRDTLGYSSMGYPISNITIIKQNETLSNYYSLSNNILTLNKYISNTGGTLFNPNSTGVQYYYIAFK